MPMIGHQAVRQQSRSRSIHGLFNNSFERLVVSVFLENGESRIGSIEHVVNQPTISRSFWSSHNRARIAFQSAYVNKRFLTPFLLPHYLQPNFTSKITNAAERWLSPSISPKAFGKHRMWILDRIYDGTIEAVKGPDLHCYLFPDDERTLEVIKHKIQAYEAKQHGRKGHQDA
jgi:hypothetical protein